MLRSEALNRCVSKLVLVGSVHGDPLGYRKLLSFFQSYGPDCILLELSPFGFEFRRKHQGSLQKDLNRNLREASRELDAPLKNVLKHPHILAMRRQISLPFEYRAAARYSRLGKASLLLVDYSPFSRRWISDWRELISTRNIRSLLAERQQSHPGFSRIYAQAASLIFGQRPFPMNPLDLSHQIKDRMWQKRERTLAKRILRILSGIVVEKPVFIGGWQHLIGGTTPPTLRSYLGIESSRCHLLDRDPW